MEGEEEEEGRRGEEEEENTKHLLSLTMYSQIAVSATVSRAW